MGKQRGEVFSGIQLLKNLLSGGQVRYQNMTHVDIAFRCCQRWDAAVLVEEILLGLENARLFFEGRVQGVETDIVPLPHLGFGDVILQGEGGPQPLEEKVEFQFFQQVVIADLFTGEGILPLIFQSLGFQGGKLFVGDGEASCLAL